MFVLFSGSYRILKAASNMTYVLVSVRQTIHPIREGTGEIVTRHRKTYDMPLIGAIYPTCLPLPVIPAGPMALAQLGLCPFSQIAVIFCHSENHMQVSLTSP